MSQEVANRVKAASIPTIAINNTALLAPWSEIFYACDYSFWIYHASWALNHAGLKVTCDDSVPFEQVMCLRNTGTSGFDSDPGCIRTGNNSGYQSLHLAIHAGAKRILLCGYDMKGDHWFGKHPPQLADADANVHRNMFIPEFEKLAPQIPWLGVEVINCTPGSALRCFPVGNLDVELSRETVSNRTTAS